MFIIRHGCVLSTVFIKEITMMMMMMQRPQTSRDFCLLPLWRGQSWQCKLHPTPFSPARQNIPKRNTHNLKRTVKTLAARPSMKQGSPYSIIERRVQELIPVLSSKPAGEVSHKPLRGLLPISLLGEQRRNGCEQFAASRLRFEPRPFSVWVQHANKSATEPSGPQWTRNNSIQLPVPRNNTANI